jgi:hypothetical protein
LNCRSTPASSSSLLLAATIAVARSTSLACMAWHAQNRESTGRSWHVCVGEETWAGMQPRVYARCTSAWQGLPTWWSLHQLVAALGTEENMLFSQKTNRAACQDTAGLQTTLQQGFLGISETA